jgi:hypothetical protein
MKILFSQIFNPIERSEDHIASTFLSSRHAHVMSQSTPIRLSHHRQQINVLNIHFVRCQKWNLSRQDWRSPRNWILRLCSNSIAWPLSSAQRSDQSQSRQWHPLVWTQRGTNASIQWNEIEQHHPNFYFTSVEINSRVSRTISDRSQSIRSINLSMS